MNTQIIKKDRCKLRMCWIITLLFLSIFIKAQETRLVSGTLTDDVGMPIVGVSVVVEGTTIGVISDMDGYYQIEAPIGSTLVYSFVGMVSQKYIVEPEAPSKKKDKKEQGNIHARDTLAKIQEKIYKHTIPKSSEKTLSPYFFVKSDNPETDRLPLKSTQAEVNIAGVIADVVVTQTYINQGENPLEAIYIFPGSTNAAVYGMTMKIGNRILQAKIKEKHEARKTYEDAKKEGKTATLLEQNRPNVFQMNVANILPGDTIEVELRYTELLTAFEGVYNFVYPTVVGPRYSETLNTEENNSENWVQNPYLQEGEAPSYDFDLKINLNSGIPVKRLQSNTHKIITRYIDKSSVEVALDASEVQGGNRDFILNYGLRGGRVESGILLYEHEDENFFLMMVEPPKEARQEDIPPREYVFIVDVSGSMHGFPLDVSKALMEELLYSLNEGDKFNILTFASSSSMLWQTSKPANAKNISYGIKHMLNQNGGGGTRLLDALNKALKTNHSKGFSRSFVVITDGFINYEKETFQTVKENLNNANLFAFGIGSSPNRYLIEGLAHAGMGEPYVATTPDAGRTVGRKMINYIQNPVLTDIVIDYGELKVYDLNPISVPDVFAQRPIIVFGKYTGETNGSIKVKGVSGYSPYLNIFNLANAGRENNQALRYLWARNKIKYFDDYAHYYENPGYGGSNSSIPKNTQNQKEQITKLGLKYNLLTQYTSFVAVDSLARNASQKIKTVKQALPLPKGVSNRAVGFSSSEDVEVTYAPNISLSEDFTALDEIVVVGYGTQKKSDMTGAVSSVSCQGVSLENSSNVSTMLQGKVSGVNVVSNSGAPGAPNTIRIRGTSSLQGNNQPLYVIDGVVVSWSDNPSVDPLAGLNPENVETIEVLKDAASTAIYGSRGTNGVIIINTKNGKHGKPELNMKSANGISWVESKSLEAHSKSYSENKVPLWYASKLRKAFTQKYDLSYSGEKEHFNFFTSAGYTNDKGVIENTGLKRYSTNNKFSASLFNSKVKTGLSFLGALSEINNTFPFLNTYSPTQLAERESLLNSKQKLGNLIANTNLDFELHQNLQFKNSFSLSYIDLDSDFKQSSLTGYKSNQASYIFQSSLNYQKHFNSNYLSLLVLYEYQNEQSETNSKIDTDFATALVWPDVHPHDFNIGVNSMACRINYSYKEKYLLNGSLRADHSKSFSYKDNWVILPAFSLGWRLSDERFLNHISLLSLLKLRYSLGMNADPRLPISSLANSSGNAFINTNYFNISLDANLQLERTRKQNLGLDLAILNNRLAVSFDYYRNYTRDMYYLNPASGLSNSFEWTNVGDFMNSGFDLEFIGYLVHRGNTRLTFRMNLAKSKSDITRLDNEYQPAIYRNIGGLIAGQELRLGDPIGLYYGFEVQGVNSDDQTITLIDKNGDDRIDAADKKTVGNVSPKLYGGAALIYSWKNFDLEAGLKYSLGNQVVNINSIDYYNNFSYTNDLTIPADQVFHELYVESGSFLRLSDLTVGYVMPQASLNRVFIKKARITLTARNLFTLTNYKGQDPEFNNWNMTEKYSVQALPGVDKNYYPVSKAVLLGFELSF